MPDVFTKEQRSEIMRKVKSKGNRSTEEKLISFFRENEIIGWRRNYKIHGNPDFVFPKNKVAIFVDGCFWHGHDCRNTRPSDNKEYWERKISRNMERDSEINEHLDKLGWKVIRIWECKIKSLNQNTEILDFLFINSK